MAGRSALRTLGALLIGAALVAASCGGDGGSTTVTADPAAPAPELSPPLPDPVRIRLALAPDPVWEWLKDSGTVAEWEATRNIRIEASSPFDQFAAFAGGHVDVVVINALEVPQFVEQSDRDPVVVGRFTSDRSFLAVRRTSSAETLDDLIEARIAVDSSLGSALLWGVIADALHGLEFRVDSPDFDLVVVESASVAGLVMRDDVDACICTPDYSVPLLVSGRLRALYDGMSASQRYTIAIFGGQGFGGESGTIADAFVAGAAWNAANTEAADALLSLWEEGLAAWRQHKGQIVADYRHLFSVESEVEVAWLTDYVEEHDWFVPSVYISHQEAETHRFAFDRLRDMGLVSEQATVPEINIVDPAAVPASSGG